MNALKLALIHFSVRYREADENREALLELVRVGAKRGAQIIVTPEMSLSGYSFDNRADVAPLAEDVRGPTFEAVRPIAREYGAYICIGLALKDAGGGILTNSVVAVGPDGEIACRYDKINAESRWACPGEATQDNTFETPWGRAGLLICSDSYYGLPPRATALRGADLLLVPANWPPAGLDPRELWRARALGNGFHLAACNRTGVDRTMDCRAAVSFVSDPAGRVLFEGKREESCVFTVDLPLAAGGRLDAAARRKCLADRRPQCYRDCYLNLRAVRDLTAFLNLPVPGPLPIRCIVPHGGEHPVEALERALPANGTPGTLILLPAFEYSGAALKRMHGIARSGKLGIAARTPGRDGKLRFFFNNGDADRQWDVPEWPFDNDAGIPRIDFGPARVHLLPFPALAHPEMVVASSKQGCDIILASETEISPDWRLLAGANTVENAAVALCARAGAGIWIPPEGHERWGERTAETGEVCGYDLDTTRTRENGFPDRIDYGVLLRQQGERQP